LEDPGILVDVRTILIWISKKWDVGHGLDQSASGLGQGAGNSEVGNEPSSSIKCGEFLNS